MANPSNSAVRFRRGDPSPDGSGLLFFRYSRGAEVWATPEKLCIVKRQASTSNAKQRVKPEQKERARLYARDYNRTPKRKAYHSEYYKRPEVKAKTAPRNRAWMLAFSKTPEGIAARKKYRSTPKHKAKAVAYMKTYYPRRMANPVNRIAHNCRSRMRDALRCQGVRKTSKTKDLIGCSFEFFRGWLEAQFTQGMTWDNYGTLWHIDHIHPIVAFELTDPAQQREAFNFRNCRPLLATENQAKWCKIIPFIAAA